MRPNTTKQTLKAGGTSIGTQIQQMTTVEAARILGVAGAEFVWIDAEHGPYHQESVHALIHALADAGATPIVRVGEYAYSLVSRALDSGAQGIILPRARDLAELREALSWTRFPPEGARGYGLGGPHVGYAKAGFPEIIAHANAHTMVIVQIENEWAVEHCDDLLELPFIDVALVGPADLSISMGIPGEVTHPRFVAAVERVIAACERRGVAPGIHLRSPAAAPDWMARGMRFVSAGAEHVFMLERATEAMTGLKQLAAKR
ncbi:MAG: aldolase/citrate lyase family protein [Vicinamibacterales bacterium]